MKRLAVLGAILALAVSAATAYATPGSGITPVDLARGTSAGAYTIVTEANRDIATQTLTFAPSTGPGTSTSGWHTHPGPVVTIVKSGTMTIWFSSDCTERTVTAGQAIVVPGAGVFDLAYNESTTEPFVLVQTYYNVPVAGALRTDAPSAQCGAEGAPGDMAVAGVTSTIHSRTRLSAALNITGTANTDLLIQQLTWAPGSTTGWHSHHGPVTVGIESGTLNFQHSDCTRTAYPAGTTLLDLGTTHEASSATTTLAFATYTNIPVGGAARIDQPAPACTAPPAPAATPIPDTATGTMEKTSPSAPLAVVLAILTSIGALSALRLARRERVPTRR